MIEEEEKEEKEEEEKDTSDAVSDEEIVAEIEGVLQELLDDELLELATKRGAQFLAPRVLRLLERKRDADIADWLVDRVEVNELYADNAEIRERFARVLARMDGTKAPERFHPQLAAAIEESPDSLEAWSVYADWLQERGDPRGELMAIQMQRAVNPNDKTLAVREESLLSRQRRHFFGELWDSSGLNEALEISFRNGFFDAVKIRDDVDNFEKDHVTSLFAHPSARFLRSLSIHCPTLALVAKAAAKTPLPRTLKELELHGTLENRSEASSFDNTEMTKHLSQLEKLTLSGHDLAVSLEGLTHLRELAVKQASSVVFLEDAFRSVVKTLERFEVSRVYVLGGEKVVVDFFKQGPKRLTEIVLSQLSLPEQSSSRILTALLTSPIAKQLRTLDVRSANINNDVARLIIEQQKDTLKKLDKLRLRGNEIDATLRDRIEERWPGAFAMADDDSDNERYDDTDE